MYIKQGFIGYNMTVDDKLMYTPNDDKQNSPFCRLKPSVENFECSLFFPTIKKNLINDVFMVKIERMCL